MTFIRDLAVVAVGLALVVLLTSFMVFGCLYASRRLFAHWHHGPKV